MGTYNNLLTTKTIRVNSVDGRETINLIRMMGKDTMFRTAPAWEQALLSRMEYLWSTRDYPKYATHDDAEDGWPVYERIEQSYFTDNYPSTRLFAGYLRRGEGKMLTFEKWTRIKINAELQTPMVGEISTKLRESGVMGGQYHVNTFNETVNGVFKPYIVLSVQLESDLTLAKMVLAGEYSFAE